MWKVCAIALALAIVFGHANGEDGDTCLRAEGTIGDSSRALLKPGEYRVIFLAESGSRKQAISEGRLWLRATRPNDRSPRTGKVAKDFDFSGVPLYGWLDADLARIGAPICSGYPHPDPSSRDPVYPGVLAHIQRDHASPFPPGRRTFLTVATLSNPRTGVLWTDGCGFAMYVVGWKEGCIVGSWEEWGLRVDGRGRYCLCPKRE